MDGLLPFSKTNQQKGLNLMLTLELLPKVVNRYHPVLNQDSEVTVNYPQNATILSGVRTVVELENRRSGETLSLNIISQEPLRPHQLRAAINQALARISHKLN